MERRCGVDYLLGIDGGGSKTALLCLDRKANVVGEAIVGTTYYLQVGVSGVIEELKKGIEQCLPAGAEAAVCFGMPGYGDCPGEDGPVTAGIASAFPELKIRFVNDVEVGWAGALALSPGVSLVAGTGSIAYGQDASGHSARCGGWHAFFSDEGSGYWLGRRLLQLFSMESDGRLERTALYDITKESLSLIRDEDINSYTDERCIHSRRETAALQRLLLQAAKAGDPQAVMAYREAADQLAEIVLGAVLKLSFPEGRVTLSCSGGLSNIESFLMEPLRDRLRERLAPLAADFKKPLLTACEGAALLAAQEFLPKDMEILRKALLTRSNKQVL
ncbi:MAG: hypothetical protein K5770_15905 [Lachnospiraceae bacterium]|nr:hypothetical protein [Lachnospiraceae bacterium]